jgi:hypothetical protein
MSIDNPTTALDRALGAEERANERVCELEDTLQRVAVVILDKNLTRAQRKKLIAELRPELDKVMA